MEHLLLTRDEFREAVFDREALVLRAGYQPEQAAGEAMSPISKDRKRLRPVNKGGCPCCQPKTKKKKTRKS